MILNFSNYGTRQETIKQQAKVCRGCNRRQWGEGDAWFKKHAKDTVIPVEIEGAPTDEETDDVEAPPQLASKPKAKKSKGGILITIQTTDALFVKKGGLD